MEYWMLRLFLTSRESRPLLDMMEQRQPETRQQFLTRAFGTEVKFPHRGRHYVFKFFHHIDHRFIAGVVARPHTVTISLPPEQGFLWRITAIKPTDIADWETANVFVDTSGDSEGQKVGMQRHAIVGSPLAVFRSLADYINSTNQTSAWSIAVNPMSKQDEFWTAVENNRGNISELDMIFVPPNIWEGQTETEKALRALHKDNLAEEVEVKIKNKDKKLHPKSHRIEQSIDYITKGGGSVRMRAGKKTLFNSDKTVVTETPKDDMPVQDTTAGKLRDIIMSIFRK